MIFAAWIMPLCAAAILPWATSCQECAGVPSAATAPPHWTVGTTQLTSPTSVDAPARWRGAVASKGMMPSGSGVACQGPGHGPLGRAHRRQDRPREAAVGVIEGDRAEPRGDVVHGLFQ